MAKIHDIKAERDKHLAHARSIAHTGSHADNRKASEAVAKAQADMIAHITEGAKPCPRCGKPPVGMEQPTGRNGSEFEIGCAACLPFQHTDGTLRYASVRGGMLPRHAVEAWNEGVENFQVVPAHKEADVKAMLAKIAANNAINAKLAADKLAAEKASAEAT